MTPRSVRKALELALQRLESGAGATFQPAWDLTSDNPPAVSMRGAVIHLDELPEIGAEHGVTVQAVSVVVELRSRMDNPDAAEEAAEHVAINLQTSLQGVINLNGLRFVTPELVERDADVPSFYTVSVVWDGLYILELDDGN